MSLRIVAVNFPARNLRVTVGEPFEDAAYTWRGSVLERVVGNGRNAKVASIVIEPMGNAALISFELNDDLCVARPQIKIVNEPYAVLYEADGADTGSSEESETRQ